jgi:hypothetical protein
MWLPHRDWNGSLLLMGDDIPIAMDALAGSLIHGYAVASASIGPVGGRARVQQRIEQANLAVHEEAEKSKALIMAYYGVTPRYSYRISTTRGSGQQTLAEVQAYPGDFDGVVFDGEGGAQGDAIAGAGTGVKAGASAGTGSPDLSAFAVRGSKIIEYEGGADQSAVENGTKHYESLIARTGGLAQTRSFYRLFLMPAEQRGDSYRADWLTVLDEWVQRGRAPDVVLADHIPPADAQQRPAPGLVFEPQFGVHTVCAYPNVARLQNGSGETPVDWMCLPGP